MGDLPATSTQRASVGRPRLACLRSPVPHAQDVTPAAVDAAIAAGSFGRALLLALHLNEAGPIHRAVEAAPADVVPLLASLVPPVFLSRLLDFVASRLAPGTAGSPHLEFHLRWALALMQCHSRIIKEKPLVFGGPLRAVHKAVIAHRDSIAKM